MNYRSVSVVVALAITLIVSAEGIAMDHKKGQKQGFKRGMNSSDKSGSMHGKKMGRQKGQKGSSLTSGPDRWHYVKDPVAFYFPGYDADNDGLLSPQEWDNRGNFVQLDDNNDGFISSAEFAVLYRRENQHSYSQSFIDRGAEQQKDHSLTTDRISPEQVGKRAICAVTRSKRCKNGDQIAIEQGLMATGMGPQFPPVAVCKGIDETFALRYLDKTGKGMHGGIDIPADFGTPILAVADGTVVGIFDPQRNARGRTVILRHSPEDTGLPFWIYTEYAHLDALPTQQIGQRISMGEYLAPTGNSGISGKNQRGVSRRRPGIHFAVYYSDSPRFAEIPNYIVPVDAKWMDSNALFRTHGPYDSVSLKQLPEQDKKVPIPVMLNDGSLIPEKTRLIWPYVCNDR